MSPRTVELLLLGLPLLAAAIVHAPALDTFFAQDDVTFLSRARGLLPTPWSMARPLSEGWMWRLLHAAFGLNPLPYHAFGLALHLASTALVYAIGRRLLQSSLWASAAALLFGVSSIAFTPLHWSSSMVELLVTAFSLAAFLTWLIARERGSNGLAWLSGAAVFAALVSKENAIFFPLVFLVAHFRLGPPRGAARLLIPPLAATVAYAAAFIATLRLVHYVGSDAYSMSWSLDFIAHNLATYLAWLASPHVPVRDLLAAMDPGAWLPGTLVGVAIAGAIWSQRDGPRHPEEVGAVWFLCFLAPVVPLAHHTYLYYLYLPLPGICWLAAAALQRGLHAIPRAASAARRLGGAAAGLSIVAIAAMDFTSIRARERAAREGLPLDKTMREAMLLENAVRDMKRIAPEPTVPIAFVNPLPRRRVSFVDTTRAHAPAIGSYTPLEEALRGGGALRLFFPGVEYLGFSDHLPREWEGARVLLYHDAGHLRDVGRGASAQAELGNALLPAQDWRRAEDMFLRSRELGETLATATYGLMITRHFLGDEAGSELHAQEFLRRWPNDPRAPEARGESPVQVGSGAAWPGMAPSEPNRKRQP